MHPTTAALFSETIEKTGLWLSELMQAMGYSRPHQAYSLLRAVLHVLRDRLTVEGAAKLGAQLPTLIRGFYYEGWQPGACPVKLHHKVEFLGRVAEACPDLEHIEQAVGRVLALLSRHISAGEIQHVLDQIPPELRGLWPSLAA
jgi:uncharacterized protein (DUF2267 family)